MAKKTSITVDEKLWARVQQAAVAWARREDIPEEGRTSMWVARALRRAAAEELGEGA